MASIIVNVSDLSSATSDRYFLSGDPTSTDAWSLESGGSSGASVPAESTLIYLDANSSAFTSSTNVSWKELVALSAYSGNITLSGVMHLKYGANINTSGNFRWPNQLWLDSTGFLLHVDASVVTQDGNNCTLYVASSGTIDNDNSFNVFPMLSKIEIMNSSELTLTGSTTTIVRGTKPGLIKMGNNTSIIANGGLFLERTGGGKYYDLGSGYSITGAGSIVLSPYHLQSDTLTAITAEGAFVSFSVDRSFGATGTLHLYGNINVPNSNLFILKQSFGGVYNCFFKQDTLTCKTFDIANGGATAYINVHLGQKVINVLTMNLYDYSTGYKDVFLDSSIINIQKDWHSKVSTQITTHKTKNMSMINFIGGTASKFDHSNDTFDIVNVNKNSGVLDSLGVGDTLFVSKLILSSGKFKQKKDIIVADSIIINSTDSCFFDTTVICCNIVVSETAKPVYLTGYSKIDTCSSATSTRKNRPWRKFGFLGAFKN